MKNHYIRILILLAIALGTLILGALPPLAVAKDLEYGQKPALHVRYTVTTSVFGCTSWDDNGIGFFGGIDLFDAKWVVAELGFHGGSTGTAMGGLAGGTYLQVTYRHKSAIVVVGDVGGGHNHYQLDLHCGVAR